MKNIIDKVNDKFFKKALENPKNAATFLQIALPESISKRINYSDIRVDPTDYVSEEYKEFFSDVVIKTNIKTGKEKIPTD
ncbi:MAG: Rpn family recombination-promoting nuclease/putative transposase, partial [Candidatus Omnitrophota bacterium]